MLESENYKHLLSQVNKVFPISKWNYFFIPITIIILLYIINISLNGNNLNKEFFNLKLKSTITNIERRENGFCYNIDSNWYLIKHPIVNYIEIGDSILKDPKSLDILIKNNVEVKWNREVKKNIVFQKLNK